MQLTVRDVPQAVVAELKEEAAARKASLNRVVRDALEAYVERRRHQRMLPGLIDAMDELRESIRARRGGVLVSDSTELIREDRDR